MKFMKYTYTLFISCLVLLSRAAIAQTLDIKTIAGTGVLGFSNDGMVGTSAQLYAPINVAVDKGENVYVVDYYNVRVRKINGGDVITTVAGTGTGGYTGDSTLATSARINPQAVAVDKLGNLYIVDGIYSVVRKVNTLGIISTVAGTGILGYTGNGGPATSARFRGMRGIAVDTFGNMYIADAENNVVRKVNTAGIVSTVAGNDTAGYSGDYTPAINARLDSPYSVAVDLIGNLFITDYKNNVIRKVDTDGIITTYAGNGLYGHTGDNGPAASAELNGPAGIAVDTAGNLYIADANNNVIRKVDRNGIITTVVGNGSAGFGGDLGPALGANLHTPFGVAVDNYHNIIIADANNERVRKAYDPHLAVNSIVKTTSLDVYPNPSAGHITLDNLSKSDKVSIHDMLGRQVGSTWDVAADGTQSFDISSLTSGVYLLQVRDANGDKIAVARFVKE